MMARPHRSQPSKSALVRLLAGRDGNVSIMFAVSLLPILLTLGSGVDYGLAMKRQARMNAAADAAALYAVSPTMMAQSSTTAKSAATDFFNQQVSGISGTNYNSSNLTITVTDDTSSSSLKRTVSVSYNATSNNSFATLLQVPTLTIKGTSQATSAVSPNIDFYLMLDTSPSMAIAATTSGIATMVANTKSQGGCAFACHETNPSGSDNAGNPGGIDNYALAQKLGVSVRMDVVRQAVQNLMTTASSTEASTGAVYRMAGYTFDVSTNNVFTLTDNLTSAQSSASNIQLLTVYSENNLTSSNKNNDEDTDYETAFSTLNSAMPAPGTGSKAAGDSPQEILFIVTDGVADVAVGGTRIYTPLGPSTDTTAWTNTWCTSIKNRGIRIAFLYTTYNPLPTNSFYNNHISAEQPNIATAAKACASPGLYFQVDSGGDISNAMTTLFQTAVASAHLIQ